ncbi:MAG: hypothetical protein IJU54_02425 [Alphaproteobacteria bacterium]|nr:hypothetical protein [Alphaproteobacteria bacterium]
MNSFDFVTFSYDYIINVIFSSNPVIRYLTILNTIIEKQEIRDEVSKYPTRIESKNNKASKISIVLRISKFIFLLKF